MGNLCSSFSGDILHNQVVLLYDECGVACNTPEYKPPIRDSASLLTAVALASKQHGMLTHLHFGDSHMPS